MVAGFFGAAAVPRKVLEILVVGHADSRLFGHIAQEHDAVGGVVVQGGSKAAVQPAYRRPVLVDKFGAVQAVDYSALQVAQGFWLQVFRQPVQHFAVSPLCNVSECT